MSGHRVGASVGFMPEPNAQFESGKDFQVAAFYRWVADATERLSAAAAVQKTWHNGATDRDLLITNLHYVPLEGWTFHGTTWVDFPFALSRASPSTSVLSPFASNVRKAIWSLP